MASEFEKRAKAFAEKKEPEESAGKDAGKGHARHMRIERAENGFVSHTEHEGEGDGGPMRPEKSCVHATLDDLKAHVGKVFGGE